MDVLSVVRDLYPPPELLSVPSVGDSGSERQWREDIGHRLDIEMQTLMLRTGTELLELEIITTRTVNTDLNTYSNAFLVVTALTILTVNPLVIRSNIVSPL